ncbi:chemotaxis protein [Clostridium botulinum]|uniref:Chemotaxis protein n=3 Tax=Clostridium botulinum TaxID=1491 RepID=A0A9Q1UWM6_CLOBO|nr:methyl-accepting chemotaxis protein [Clostridium botulinum BKT015925]KLU75784.1 chemotaxis protein [Clostridium botulinum V891]KOA73143.1 chemotaxis protein [Clostridium botulinum]MCD3197459.1 chemotaxis protein [Clostridium botulinum C/D]KOA74992.1 chemotaxis protein [Clostridium botulinum]
MYIMKKISSKIATMAIVISTITAILIGSISIYQLFSIKNKVIKTQRDILIKNYDISIKQEVQSAISILDGIYKRYERGELTIDKAKEEGANVIRNIRYGKEGYLWIDTIDGVNVVLLGDCKIEGTNRYYEKDSKGNSFMKSIIENGKKDDGGFTEYYFPKQGGTKELPKRAYSKLYKPFNWVIGTGNYIDSIHSIVDKNQSELETKIHDKIIVIFIILVMGIIVASIVGIIVGEKISKPILFITNLIKKITEFDLVNDSSYNVILKYKDETGTIGKSVLNLEEHLRSIFKELKQNSDNVCSSSKVLSQSSQSTVQSINAVGKTLEELAKGSVDQAKDSQEIVESMASFADKINLMVDASNKVNEFLKETDKVNIQGKDSMDLLNEKFEDNRVSLKLVSNDINELSTKSSSIGNIVNQIEEIADQTNLLALNAAIEAARAGEHGKGFAVVAEEVRKLSEQVQMATQQIASEIESIQEQIAKSKDNMNNSEHVILEVNSAVDETQKIFEAIEKSNKNTINEINGLYKNIMNVSSDKDKILESVDSISAISEESAAGLQEVSASMTEQTQMTQNAMDTVKNLQNVVVSLNDIVSKFKI